MDKELKRTLQRKTLSSLWKMHVCVFGWRGGGRVLKGGEMGGGGGGGSNVRVKGVQIQC